PCDVRGLLHSHTRYADGAHSLRRMVETARDLGLEYLGISDHMRSAEHPEGLDAEDEEHQHEEIAALKREFPDFEVLHGVEVNVSPEGELLLPTSVLDRLDYVLADLPDPDGHTKESYTEAALRVVRHPSVNIVSKPVGAYMTATPPVPLDMMRLLKAAAETYTVVELDANPSTPELDTTHCKLAAQLGVLLAINPNAHRAARLVDYRQGVDIAREMGLDCAQIVNTWPIERLREKFGDHG
ncbi:PHP domain-containing protein, partial [bacterium]|nr:PHP domain-containing protein [bacterium]